MIFIKLFGNLIRLYKRKEVKKADKRDVLLLERREER